VPLLQHESQLQLLPSDFDDSFMRKPVWIWLGVFLVACVLALPADPARTAWYVGAGFFTALGLLIYHLFISFPLPAGNS
jgi:hypothetical protein